MKVAVSLLALSVATAALADSHPMFLRGGIVTERSRDAVLRDRDCSATAPPALFGCGFNASGDFGDSAGLEAAAGVTLDPHTRVELAFEERPNVDFRANANFTNGGDEQPVRAEGRSHALFAAAVRELGEGRVRPFVRIGAGVARNELGRVTYSFPALAANATTITAGGKSTSFAWTLGAGTSFRISDRLAVDAALRYTDLGSMQTDDGSATIVRPGRTFMLDIAGTAASLRVIGVSVGLRFGVGRP